MAPIARITRSSGARLRRISSALVTSMTASPTETTTTTSETTTRDEMLSGESTSTSVPARNTAPLMRLTFQNSGR